MNCNPSIMLCDSHGAPWQKQALMTPIYRPPDKDLSRIWWICTGIASSLPFHAAGLHTPGSIENTLSWAISSYTPSIRALRHAREKANFRSEAQAVLLVTMPETPGYDNLPGVIVDQSHARRGPAAAFHPPTGPPE
jgi:hypothetical protein